MAFELTLFGKLECGDEFKAAYNGEIKRFIKISDRKAKFFDTNRGKFVEIKFGQKELVAKVE